MNSFRPSLPVLAGMFLLWAVVYASHGSAGFYGDDFLYVGAARYSPMEHFSILFADQVPAEGFSFVNFAHFLHRHYMDWGGRIVGFAILVPFLEGGPQLFFLVQSILVSAMLLLFAGFAAGSAGEGLPPSAPSGPEKVLAVLLALALFCSIPLPIFREGILWATASALYVWPVFFLLLALRLLERSLDGGPGAWPTGILLFLAASCNEMISLMCVGALSVILLLRLLETRRVTPRMIILALCVLAGMLLLFCAPGNFARMRIEVAGGCPPVPVTISDLLRQCRWAAAFLVSLDWGVLLLLALGGTASLMHAVTGLRSRRAMDTVRKKALFALSVTWWIPSLMLVLMPASRVPRALTPQLILAIPLVVAVMPPICRLGGAARIACLPILLALLLPYMSMADGYQANAAALRGNEAILRSWKPGTDVLHLKRLPVAGHAFVMPYEVAESVADPQSFHYGRQIEESMRRHYGIPRSVVFVWDR